MIRVFETLLFDGEGFLVIRDNRNGTVYVESHIDSKTGSRLLVKKDEIGVWVVATGGMEPRWILASTIFKSAMSS